MQEVCDQLVKCCSKSSHSVITRPVGEGKSASLASELAPPSIQVIDSSIVGVETALGQAGDRHITKSSTVEEARAERRGPERRGPEVRSQTIADTLAQWCSGGEQEGAMDQVLEDIVVSLIVLMLL